jgi:hypothetical protein
MNLSSFLDISKSYDDVSIVELAKEPMILTRDAQRIMDVIMVRWKQYQCNFRLYSMIPCRLGSTIAIRSLLLALKVGWMFIFIDEGWRAQPLFRLWETQHPSQLLRKDEIVSCGQNSL